MKKTAMNALSLALLMPSFSAFAQTAAPVAPKPAAAPVAQVARPPQYVILAFDGSKSLPFWKESLDWADAASKQVKAPVKFTYFISGVYYLAHKNRMLYPTPGMKPGKSAINFSDTAEEIVPRMAFTNRAFETGHEIASHANGHYSGVKEKWTEEHWNIEFTSFTDLVFNASNNNKIEAPAIFLQSDVIGFRAPELGHTPGMWPALVNHNFAYDTSKTSQPNYWPKKEKSIWNFPLASLKIAGTGQKTLSMDFNFLVAANPKGESDPVKENHPLHGQRMLDTYRNYFKGNYYGNRAPIHIGHHFSKWNSGVYWKAMKDFALEVCGMPEVKCVTYAELTRFMESQTDAQIAGLQAGNFPKLPIKPSALDDVPRALDLDSKIVSEGDEIRAEVTVSDRDARGLEYKWMVNEKEVGTGLILSNEIELEAGDEVAFVVEKDGQKVFSSTRPVEKVLEGQVELAKKDLESRALEGDLHEAHAEE